MCAKANEVPLLSEAEILALPSPGLPEHDCGIYFLLKGDKIRYVGKSESSTLARVAAHRRKFGSKFDRFVTIESAHRCFEYVEALYISKFRPDLNKVAPCPEVALFGQTMKLPKRGRKDWISAVAYLQMKIMCNRRENEDLADATSQALKEIGAISEHFAEDYSVPAAEWHRLYQLEIRWRKHDASKLEAMDG